MSRAGARIVGAIAGVCVVICGFLYFAWAASLSNPVDWADVASVTAFFAPLGLMGAFVGDELAK